MDFHLQNKKVFLITDLDDPLCRSWIIPDFTIPHAFAKTLNGHLKKLFHAQFMIVKKHFMDIPKKSFHVYQFHGHSEKKHFMFTSFMNIRKKAFHVYQFHGHSGKKHFMFTSFIMFGQGFDPANFRLLIVHLQPLGHFLNGKSNLKLKFNLNLVKIIKDYESHIRFD